MPLPAPVVSALNESICRSLNLIGQSAGLAPLDWQAIQLQETLLVQGNPVSRSGLRECAQWAEALSLSLLTETTDSGSSMWSASTGAWMIQLNAELLDSDLLSLQSTEWVDLVDWSRTA